MDDLSTEELLSMTVAIPAIFYKAFLALIAERGSITLDLNKLYGEKPTSFQIEVDREKGTIRFFEGELNLEALIAQLESIGQEKH